MALRMPRMPRMPRMSRDQSFSAGQSFDGGGGSDSAEEDIRAQMQDALVRFIRHQEEGERLFPRQRAELGQSFSQRGLGWSGLRTGAEGRSLEDFTSEMGGAALEHQMEMDALERALRAARETRTSSGSGTSGRVQLSPGKIVIG